MKNRGIDRSHVWEVSVSYDKNNAVFYEQPLNERVRAFLRLEYLFQRFEHQIPQGDDAWASRVGVESIIDILTMLGRMDVKSELIKELERQIAIFEGLAHNPNVDSGRLGDTLAAAGQAINAVRAMESVPGAELQKNILLNTVRQRNGIPAGACGFDMPAFDYWLHNLPDRRKSDLEAWYSVFDVIRDAVFLCLRSLRESATARSEQATGGFFHRTVDKGLPLQLMRVALPAGAPWYPEISAGRHRFTIRFMTGSAVENRPVQTGEDVGFKVFYCAM